MAVYKNRKIGEQELFCSEIDEYDHDLRGRKPMDLSMGC
jgi:hypothetical protein